jgi:hypothetical protein
MKRGKRIRKTLNKIKGPTVARNKRKKFTGIGCRNWKP